MPAASLLKCHTSPWPAEHRGRQSAGRDRVLAISIAGLVGHRGAVEVSTPAESFGRAATRQVFLPDAFPEPNGSDRGKDGGGERQSQDALPSAAALHEADQELVEGDPATSDGDHVPDSSHLDELGLSQDS